MDTPEKNPQIMFDKPKFEALKRRYDLAVKWEEKQFEFEGHELLTSYAKYLLQYLAPNFPPDNRK